VGMTIPVWPPHHGHAMSATSVSCATLIACFVSSRRKSWVCGTSNTVSTGYDGKWRRVVHLSVSTVDSSRSANQALGSDTGVFHR